MRPLDTISQYFAKATAFSASGEIETFSLKVGWDM